MLLENHQPACLPHSGRPCCAVCKQGGSKTTTQATASPSHGQPNCCDRCTTPNSRQPTDGHATQHAGFQTLAVMQQCEAAASEPCRLCCAIDGAPNPAIVMQLCDSNMGQCRQALKSNQSPDKAPTGEPQQRDAPETRTAAPSVAARIQAAHAFKAAFCWRQMWDRGCGQRAAAPGVRPPNAPRAPESRAPCMYCDQAVHAHSTM